MEGGGGEVHDASKRVQILAIWERLSSLHKLLFVSAASVLLAFAVERWGLLIVLIVTIMGLACLTDKALAARYDPVAQILESTEKCREALSRATWPPFGKQDEAQKQGKRIRK
jgi:predicted membrane-bound mannosyltransferase